MGVGPGSPFPGPLASAGVVNSILLATAHHEQQKRLGDPDAHEQRWPSTDVVKVRNDSGGDRRQGDVLEIDRGSGLLTDPLQASALWFKGLTPDTTRAFGIFRAAIKASQIGPLQVSGVCKAYVNVTDADHTFAVVKSGDHVLQSAAYGPVEIVYKPSGTGEKEAVVRFATPPSVAVLIQIWATSGSPVVGDLLVANADGYLPARMVRLVGSTMETYEDVWARAVDWHSVDSGAGPGAIGEHGRFHTGLTMGQVTSASSTRPRVVFTLGHVTYLSKPDQNIAKGVTDTVSLYNGDETDSLINVQAKALGAAVVANKWTITQRGGGGTFYVGCWETT